MLLTHFEILMNLLKIFLLSDLIRENFKNIYKNMFKVSEICIEKLIWLVSNSGTKNNQNWIYKKLFMKRIIIFDIKKPILNYGSNSKVRQYISYFELK